MFHIISVPFGVVLPVFILIANYKGLRNNDGVGVYANLDAPAR
jgi:cytochrome bd-type quinol oxidase subunit 1